MASERGRANENRVIVAQLRAMRHRRLEFGSDLIVSLPAPTLAGRVGAQCVGMSAGPGAIGGVRHRVKAMHVVAPSDVPDLP
jgi:hypothetical protein